MKKILIIIIVVFLSMMSLTGKELCEVKFLNSLNNEIILNVEIALTPFARSKGLMYRKKMKNNNGMIFIYSKEQYLSFWMKNTYLPLSIAYLNEKGIINSIFKMIPLDSSIIYNSREKSQFAIEVNQGWFKKNKINIGNRVIIDGCISK